MQNKQNGNNVVLFIVAFFLGAGAFYAFVHLFPTSIIKTTTKLKKEVTVNEKGIADAVEKVYDSVVVVSNYKSDRLQASGTGFVYDTDDKNAYILTNYHVIESGNQFSVQFTNETKEEAKLVGGDKYSDIAVLSVNKDKILSVAELGKSSELKVGDTLFTVGAPLANEYSWSVTRGILSGKDRLVEVSLSNSLMSDYVMKVLQTDAAINSGNSGGPLSNSNGEVIGITSLKLMSTGVEGMGFAIPIETALSYASKIRNDEEIERPYIGVSMLNVSDTMYYDREYYQYVQDLKLSTGVIITKVESNSPAEKSGLEKGDIVTKMGKQDIKSIAYFKYNLYSYEVGDKVQLEVIRNGKTINIDLNLATNK